VSLLRYARLPRPASTAAPPIPNSRASCSPAVPPPPVGGGPVGKALGEETGVCAAELCDGDGLVCEADGLVSADAALVCDGDELVCDAGGFVEVAGAAAEWLPVGEPAGDEPAGLVPAGAVGVDDPLELPEPVHAETETETTTVKVAQAAK
jgi:hypothetical protein